MPKAKHVMGKDLMFFLEGKALALATSCKFTIKADMQDAASKDSGVWDEKDVSKISYEGSTDSLFTDDPSITHVHTELTRAMLANKAIPLVFGIASNATTSQVPEDGWAPPTSGHYKGKAKITNVDFNAPNGDKATLAVSFTGHGELEIVDIDAPAVQGASSQSAGASGVPIEPAQTKTAAPTVSK